MTPAAAQDGVTHASLASLLGLNVAARSLSLLNPRAEAERGGALLSAFKGRGMEVDEVRPYQPGDDVRAIDWRVTARTGRAHTKVFREERERPVIVCADFRAAMFFATRGRFKSVAAARAAALLAWAAQQRGDRVGGLLFSEAGHVEVKPRLGRGGLLPLLKAVAEQSARAPAPRPGEAARAADQALQRLTRVTRPGSQVFVLSDFRLPPGGERLLAQLARHSRVWLFFVHDPFEAALPPPGRYRLSDGIEELTLDAGDHSAAAYYRERFEAHRETLARLARRAGMRVIPLSTAQDPGLTLAHALR